MTLNETVTNALVRSVDLYVWQNPKLPRFGHFDLTTRWRGRQLLALREAKRITEDCIAITLTIVSDYFFTPGEDHASGAT